ncbi:MAG TPA: DUF1697 domain-containing protein [Opitutaceae bacterium]|jgi:uncharacterized protein (DUF1697 family)
MAVHLALIRGINLAGTRKVPMENLRAFATRLGLAPARTILQSGNLIFRSPRRPAALEKLLESESEKRLGLKTEFFVRTLDEWKAIIAANPFPSEARNDPSHLLVVFLKDGPTPEHYRALRAAYTGPEVILPGGRQAYATYPAGIADSRLSTALIDRTLGTRATARNWNTVLKMAALAGSL